MSSRGFAGGLAEGINQGMQMYALHENLKSRKAQDERAAAADARDQESHALKMEDAANNRKMTEEWAGLLGWKPEMAAGSPVRPDAPNFGAPPEQQTPSQSVKLAGPIPSGGLAMNAPQAPYAADNPMPGLQPQQPPQQQAAPVTADQFIQRQVLQTNAFSNPEMLNKMAAIALKYNQSDKGIAFLNQAYTAHEKGLPIAMGKLMEGDTKGAADILRGRGVNIEGDLTPVEGKQHTWKATVDGKEREFNLRDMAMAANPAEAYKNMAEAQERARKAKLEQDKHDLDVDKHNLDKKKVGAEIDTERSKQSLNSARAKALAGGGGSSAKELKGEMDYRGKQFDLASKVKDPETGETALDPNRRLAYERATYAQQNVIEAALNRRLSAAEHRDLTDAMLDYPVDAANKGDKAAVQQWQAALMDRMGIDPADQPEEQGGGKQPDSLSGKGETKKQEAAPEALKAAKEPTQEEKELAAVSSDATAVPEMKRLQRERTATNLSPVEREENTRQINALLAKHGPKDKGGLGYGKRPDGTEKGKGFLGVQKTKSGKDMTEYSVGLKINGKERDVPTLVPGLTKKEIEYLKTEPDLSKRTPMNDAIIRKASEHAKKRLSAGKSVYADET